MKRVFSGIQPTGNLHLGNYLGAIRNWVAMQAEYECIYCIVDLHAITLPHDPKGLAQATRDMAAGILAAGVDPARTILFHQSAVTAHAELAWTLMSIARTGWLDRMIQFKEKRGKDAEGPSVGLYTYPVLQAADILAYRATHVPVGEDQKQHLELARDIAVQVQRDVRRGAARAAAAGDRQGGGADHVACATAPRRCRSPTRARRAAST